MAPSTSPGHAEDLLDVSGEHCRPDHEQSTLFGSGHRHFPLSGEEEDEDHAREVSSWKRLPWWKKPSPYWLIFGVPIGSIGSSAIFAPKVALYTALACRVHRPEFITNDHSLHTSSLSPRHDLAEINAAGAPIPDTSDAVEIAVDAISVLLPDPTYTTMSGSSRVPDPEQRCASDPVVQAVVARLNAVFNTTMGVLSCLTTGWWGCLSDRCGRRVVIFVSLFGLLVNDVTHVITAWFVDALPGGYWFPLVGYFIEGVCGSLSTGVATYHAYLADTTDPSTRSRYFSLSLGFMFTGIALGPVLGGLLIRATGTMLSAFYFASIIHGIYTILILFILPESVTRARARGARLRRRQEKVNQASSGRALRVSKGITGFLRPLVVLLPEQSSSTSPLKRSRRDWSLLCIAIAYGLVTSIIGSFPYKFQYAAAQFNWTSEITSYYISLVGATRACFLAITLPLIIKYLKPTPVQLPCTPDEPLRGAAGLSPIRGARSLPGSAESNSSERRLPPSRSPAFDLTLARVSAGLEIASYLAMAVASTGVLFTIAGTIGSFGAGFSPAVQALALDIYTNRRAQNRGEVGRLFGALSVIQALGSQIISPALYGFVYFKTVATFPRAIMVVSSCVSFLALIFLSFVRVSSGPAGDCAMPECGDEERTQGVGADEALVAIGVEGQAVERR